MQRERMMADNARDGIVATGGDIQTNGPTLQANQPNPDGYGAQIRSRINAQRQPTIGMQTAGGSFSPGAAFSSAPIRMPGAPRQMGEPLAGGPSQAPRLGMAAEAAGPMRQQLESRMPTMQFQAAAPSTFRARGFAYDPDQDPRIKQLEYGHELDLDRDKVAAGLRYKYDQAIEGTRHKNELTEIGARTDGQIAVERVRGEEDRSTWAVRPTATTGDDLITYGSVQVPTQLEGPWKSTVDVLGEPTGNFHEAQAAALLSLLNGNSRDQVLESMRANGFGPEEITAVESYLDPYKLGGGM